MLCGRRQIALFRCGTGEQIYALSNFDPFSRTMVVSQGIVGDRHGEPIVSSKVYQQSFRLSDGLCLHDADVSLTTFPVRIIDGDVDVFVSD